jgi:putative iron-regulated protein
MKIKKLWCSRLISQNLFTNKNKSILSSLILGIFLFGCGQLPFMKKESDDDLTLLAVAAIAIQQADAAKKAAFIDTYSTLAFKAYSDTYSSAIALQTKVDAYVATGGTRNATTFAAMQTEWRKARIEYLLTEAFRFSEGPIDNSTLTNGKELEPLLNAWPIDEGHINGIIATGGFTSSSLLSSNEGSCAGTCPDNDPSKNISVGWHAIEFILWDTDATNNSIPGPRAFGDITDANNSGTTQQKRAAYLKIATDLLVSDLLTLKTKWDPNSSDTYVTSFKSNPSKSLENVLKGMAKFAGGEWGGERMTGTFSGEQEEEHSCFSDNTKHDFYYDAIGFQNVFNGEFKGTSYGIGLDQFFGSEATRVKSNLAIASRFCLNEYNENPTTNATELAKCSSDLIQSRFDRMIKSLGTSGTSQENADYTKFSTEIQPAVQTIAKSFQKVAQTLGVNIGDDGLKL